ncbi:hypothetical protein [Alteriqipengyuania lutimaris]|uniref:hypothetical protein n=1 Tax=Alteriqipengyuania lutimaris TaxID=1538146 RepID=UPI001CFD8D38|nr:hypothetical protein [Alteriqipengyuania lutimaris]
MTDKIKPPKKPRRQRVDSVAGVAAAIVAGGKKIALPAGTTLTLKERKVFTELCEEFSRSELTAHKIRLLLIMAQQLVLLNEEQQTLAREGFAIVNANGNTIPNPRARACATLNSTILAMRRSLGIHTRAQAGGDNREAALRRSHNKANEAILDDMDDDLIARPNVVPFRAEETDDDE